MKNITETILVGCFTFIAVLIPLKGNTKNYHEQGLGLMKAIHAELVSLGYCAEVKECRSKRLSFLRRVEGGIEFEFYEVKETDFISGIVIKTMDLYKLENEEISLRLRFYKESHEDTMGFNRFFVKPFILMDLKGNK